MVARKEDLLEVYVVFIKMLLLDVVSEQGIQIILNCADLELVGVMLAHHVVIHAVFGKLGVQSVFRAVSVGEYKLTKIVLDLLILLGGQGKLILVEQVKSRQRILAFLEGFGKIVFVDRLKLSVDRVDRVPIFCGARGSTVDRDTCRDKVALDGGKIKLVEVDGVGIGLSVCLKRQQRLSRGGTGAQRKRQEKDGQKQSG